MADKVAPTGTIVARRGKELRLAGRIDYVAAHRPGLLPRTGDALELCSRRERVDPDGAWWRTAGPGWRFSGAPRGLVRLYWKIELADLPTLIRCLTSLLAEDERAWMLKVARAREVHSRADAVVLYLTWETVSELAASLEAIARDIPTQPQGGAPPLCLPIRPGLAAAFEPGGDESYGQHRCRLIVEALDGVDLSQGIDPVSFIEARLAVDEIDLERPYARRTDRLLPWE